MNKSKLLLLGIIALVVMVVGMIAFRLGKHSNNHLIKSSPEKSALVSLPPASPTSTATENSKEQTGQGKIKIKTPIFFIKSNPTSLTLKPIICEITGDEVDYHILALKRLFAGPPPETGLQSVFNKDTKVLGFTLKDKLAVVNLNQKIKEINVGASGEALVIASIVNTLTKFPDVDQVKIQVEGEYIETLAGHVELMDNKFSYDGTEVEN